MIDFSLHFSTDDAAVIAVLNLAGFYPQHVEMTGPKVWFCFEPTPELTAVVDSYTRGSLTVSAKMFAMLYRDATATMRNRQRQTMQQAAAQ